MAETNDLLAPAGGEQRIEMLTCSKCSCSNPAVRFESYALLRIGGWRNDHFKDLPVVCDSCFGDFAEGKWSLPAPAPAAPPPKGVTARIALSSQCDNDMHSGCPYPERCRCACHTENGLCPGEPCEKCGSSNITWFAPSALWNQVVRAHGHLEMLCPVCFVQLAEAAGVNPTAWRMAPETHPPTSTLTLEELERIEGYCGKVMFPPPLQARGDLVRLCAELRRRMEGEK